jgi:hypothetical protein
MHLVKNRRNQHNAQNNSVLFEADDPSDVFEYKLGNFRKLLNKMFILY